VSYPDYLTINPGQSHEKLMDIF